MQRFLIQLFFAATLGLTTSHVSADRFETVKGTVVISESVGERDDDPVKQTVDRTNPRVVLVVSMKLSDSGVTLRSIDLVRIAAELTPTDAELVFNQSVRVSAIKASSVNCADAADDDTVGTAILPDRRSKILEGVGVAAVPSQDVLVAIPIRERPSKLCISRPMLVAPDEISIEAQIATLCNKFRRDPACVVRMTGATGLIDPSTIED